MDFYNDGMWKSDLVKEEIKTFTKVGNYMLKSNNRSIRAGSEICSKLTVKTPEWRHWLRYGVFILNLEHVLHLVSEVSGVNFEHVNAGWYRRYFDGTLLSAKRHNIDKVLNHSTKILSLPHFLDIETCHN